MSSQTQQPLMPSQSQQPVVIYPNTKPPPSGSSSHSNGSFGTVFIVLAVIIVISGIACCLGRLCNKKKVKSIPKQNHKVRSKEREFEFRPKERDMEFGFENGIPMGRPVPHSHGGLKGFKPSENGHLRGEQLRPMDREPKAAGPMMS
ncbi:hypothetical protein HS088_TW10G00066 [Tripterygium wilfordii]|uniref:Transmembrane protein n=1 Tax=Tripterygium wilfordii TaxID=458696 RepID=A0A7J7D422_TRIWF|nr:uncharacterized protein LOC120007175 [Tripterygium wilfordii]KAF5741071.1 hypothetical protein HS088_TW10G00066 [Tripterygium wilfordii]